MEGAPTDQGPFLITETPAGLVVKMDWWSNTEFVWYAFFVPMLIGGILLFLVVAATRPHDVLVDAETVGTICASTALSATLLYTICCVAGAFNQREMSMSRHEDLVTVNGCAQVQLSAVTAVTVSFRGGFGFSEYRVAAETQSGRTLLAGYVARFPTPIGGGVVYAIPPLLLRRGGGSLRSREWQTVPFSSYRHGRDGQALDSAFAAAVRIASYAGVPVT